MRLFKSARAIAGLTVVFVIVILVIAMSLSVGVIITSQLKAVVDTMSLTGQANSTVNSAFTNIFAAFSLSTIIPIIAAAGGIITTVVAAMFFYFRREGS